MEKEVRILMLEDVASDAELVEWELRKGKIMFTSLRVDTKEDFEKQLDKFYPDIIISDYQLPHFDGMSALLLAKELAPSVPFIMVTGSINEETAIRCMKAGAADYVIKERLARISSAVKSSLEMKWSREEKAKAEERLRQSYGKLQKAMEGTIEAIARVVEMRDPYTAGHQRRVAKLASAIAEEMGFSEEIITGIRMAGIIHDIGKISVPAEILSKPGKLSQIEFELIKTHAQVGYDILKSVEFPWPIAKVVLQHHERIDGLGYPNGIKGNDILIEAKIVGVADVVEAMASHRPYRPALGIGIALKEIRMNRGTAYDPDVVDACIRLFQEKGYKLEQIE
ncbi:MAG: HD domain-containing protein [Clostridia bacterium]|nr:HD domain-containing protein [Clostridia bacterium]